MTVAAVSVLYAILVTALVQMLLAGARWQVWRPGLALACWHAAAGSSLVAGVVAVAAVLRQMAEGRSSQADSMTLGLLATWAALFVAGCLGARLLARMDRVVGRDLASHDAVREALECPRCTVENLAGVEVRTVLSGHRFALSCRLPEPTIVLSSSLRLELTEAEVHSVVEHERAHLTGRHHAALRTASAHLALLPWFGPAQQLERSTRLLIELIADDTAVRRCGAKAVAGALNKMATPDSHGATAMRAERILARGGESRRSTRQRSSLRGMQHQ